MSKILVTGGGGFIGTTMVKYLLQKGEEVRIFDVSDRIEKQEGAEIFVGSVLSIDDLNKAMKDCDYVIHLAAKMGVQNTEAYRLDCLQVNLQGTINVLDACVKNNIKKILYSSSSEVYGDQTKIPIAETNPVNPKSVYGVTKLASEEYLKAYKQRYDLDYSIVRFFNVYGVGQAQNFVMSKFIDNATKNRPLEIYGSGNQVRAFCYVEDAVRGAYLALKNPMANSKVFNIGNDTEPISMSDLARVVIDIVNKNSNTVFTNHAIFTPFEKSDRTKDREIERRIPDISRAKRVLGYEPKISLKEGIKKCLKKYV